MFISNSQVNKSNKISLVFYEIINISINNNKILNSFDCIDPMLKIHVGNKTYKSITLLRFRKLLKTTVKDHDICAHL